MATVHTAFGPGEIIASETVRGRTQHKVAVNGNQVWIDEAKLGITRVADAFAWQPPSHHPDAPADSFSHLGDEDPYYEQSHLGDDPHHDALMRDVDEYGYGEFGDELGGALSPQVHENPGYNKHAPGYDPHRDYTQWEDGRLGWAPVDHDNSVNLPYDPTPQYPAIPGDTESTLQPIHEIDADERLSPADSITFENRQDDESELEPTGPNFENPHTGAIGDPTPHQTGPYGLDRNAPELREYAHPSMRDDDEMQYGSGETDPNVYQDWQNSGGWGNQGAPLPGPGQQASPYDYPQYGAGSGSGDDPQTPWNRQSNTDLPGHMTNVHEGFAFLIPLAEGLMGAGAGAAGAGAAEGGMASAMGGGLARGVGQGAAMNALSGGGGEEGQQQQAPGQGFVDATSPGEGWGELQRGAALNEWLASRETPSAGIGSGLSSKYIDITSSADYYSDPVAQFRHDPGAFISRLGHVEDEPVSPEMEHYGQLVEASAQVREAAWSDVRQKAMRLRREGRVHVKDVDTDRIYASVDGDHGTYDVMIAKGGAFGGFGGGHSITNWRCACEWGRWAFQRRLTYVGRLCSHGYAAYMEMQSAHVKGQPRQRRLTRPYTKRADALQNVPQRLVPELVINDSEDAQQFLDVEKDERKDTGPDDIVSDTDIVHFARVLTACEQNNWPYPRELVAFLEYLGEDQTKEDWKVEDAGKAAESALNEIRDWADTPQAEDYGHMEERNDEIRDAVDEARDGGTDASQMVAFRTAAPGQPRDINDMMGVQPQSTPLAPGFTPGDLSSYPGVSGGPNATSGPLPNVSGTADTRGNVTPGAPADPTGGMMSGPYGGGGAGGKGGAPPPPTNNAGGGGNFYQQNYGAGGGKGGAGGGAPIQGPGIGNHDQGKAGGDTPSNAIGQGDYQIQSGDTLSDIAQRSGYGGDYNSLAQQNQIADPNKINAGDTINIGKPGGGGGEGGKAGGGEQNQWGNGKGPQATDNPATNAPGGPLNQNSGGSGADEGSGAAAPPASNPAQTGSNPATPQNTPQVDTGAIPGGSPGGSGGATDTSVANQGAGGGNTKAPSVDTPNTSDTGNGQGGGGGQQAPAAPDMSGMSSMIGDIGGIAGDLMHSFTSSKYAIFADQDDYDEWQRYAYPHGHQAAGGPYRPGEHQPFAGSGPVDPIEYSTSEEYADKARKKMDDVTDLKDHNVIESAVHGDGGGIRRAGHGPRRVVTPVVVREQKPTNGRVVEAYVPDEFDALAPRTAASFDDPYSQADAEAAAVLTAANSDDIVANFQRSAGAQAVMSSVPSAQDNFDIAEAAAGFLQKTAGRNYSLAEQAELIREGDVGGAGNLDRLDLRGTHYEAEHSVGLFT